MLSQKMQHETGDDAAFRRRMKAGKHLVADMMTERVIREINQEKQLLAKPELGNVADRDEAIMTELGYTIDDMAPTDLQAQLDTMDMDSYLNKQPGDTGLPTPAHPRRTHQAQKTKAHNKTPQKTPTKTTPPPKKKGDTGIPTAQPENGRDGRIHRRHQTQRKREGTVKKPTGQRKKVRCLFLMPFVAVIAHDLLLVPTTHMEGPVLLLPMIRKMCRCYTLPPRYRRNNQQDPAPHNYRMGRPCILLLHFACFFHTPTAPSTGYQPTTITHQSQALRSSSDTTHATTTSGSSNVGTYNPTQDTGGYTSSGATAASYQDPPSLCST